MRRSPALCAAVMSLERSPADIGSPSCGNRPVSSHGTTRLASPPTAARARRDSEKTTVSKNSGLSAQSALPRSVGRIDRNVRSDRAAYVSALSRSRRFLTPGSLRPAHKTLSLRPTTHRKSFRLVSLKLTEEGLDHPQRRGVGEPWVPFREHFDPATDRAEHPVKASMEEVCRTKTKTVRRVSS